MRLVSLAAILAATVTALPVGAATLPAPHTSFVRPGPVSSPYASYLVGRFAMAMGDVPTASQAMMSAASMDPANSDLREKAFLVSILNGDIDGAAQLMPAGQDVSSLSDTGKLMGGLVGVASASRADRPALALKSVDQVLKVDADQRSALMLKPYVQAMNGQWTAALDASGDDALNKSDNGALTVFLLRAERARLYEIQGKAAEADTIYKSLYQPGAASYVFGPDYAAFLERQGRKDEARAIWKSLSDGSNDPLARDGLARLDAAKFVATPLPSLKVSMAEALLMSATLYSNEHDSEMALANARLSLYLDPSSDRARLFLGQTELELKVSESAETAWAGVPASSPYGAEAMLRRIWSLRARGENDQALTLADDALKTWAGDVGFTVEKADILHDQGHDEEALKVLNDRIAAKGEGDMTWQAYFIQAIAYDSVNDWDKAEAAIKKAQAINGQRPEVLNFLGYGWIDRGLHVKEGMDLIRQAMQLSPRSGAIVDSLGWGYYKLGQYDQALSFVEQAVQMEPSDAEVNEHLGDVYQAMGRTAEARYEWQRVLTLNATPRELASVKAKLEPTAVAAVLPAVPAKGEATAFNDAQAPATQAPVTKAKSTN